MYKHLMVIPLALVFFLAASTANALDYTNWVPLLPESIGGLDKAGEPNGANVEKSGESWATVQQDYSDGSGEEVTLTIVAGGMSPQLQQFRAMKQFTMETGEKLVKTLKVSGYESIFELKKQKNSGTLLMHVKEKTLVIIESNSVTSKDALISLADDVPLSEIQAQEY
ncbi:MAG: hypothetical protein V5B78_02070 [Desulfohalobiaceae bacterium]